MGDKIELNAEIRTLHGKKVAQLRRDGLVPAVIYGADVEPLALQAPVVAFTKVVHTAGKHHPVYVQVDGKKHIAMIKDIDLDPRKQTLRHVALHAVNQKETVEAEVPIRLVGMGESAAERAGLVILQTVEKINVKALPANLPDALEVDITVLAEAGQHVTIGDLVLPKNVEIVDNKSGHEEEENAPQLSDLVIASVYEPGALAAANDAAGGDAEDESEVEAENGTEEEPVAEKETK